MKQKFKTNKNLTNQKVMNAVSDYLESYYSHVKDFEVTYMLKEGMKEPTEHLDGLAYYSDWAPSFLKFGFKIIKKEFEEDHIIPAEEFNNLITECYKHHCNCLFYIIVFPCGCVNIYNFEDGDNLGPVGTTIEVEEAHHFNIFDN